MKKGFTLIEILVSVSLIVVVIGAFYKISSNSFNLLEKSKQNRIDFEIIALSFDDKKDKKIFLDDLIDLKDDEIRRDLKEVRIIQKVRDTDKIDLEIVKLNETEISLKYKDKEHKFYSFKIQ